MPFWDAASQPSLTLQNLSCERDDRVLFSQLQYNCPSGTVLQIIGFNGAGKTTLLHTVAGLMYPLEGQVLWCGETTENTVRAFRQNLFYLGHQAPVKGHLTVQENIRWLASLHSQSDISAMDEALAQVELDAYRDSPCYALSAGQRRRVALAQLYINRAPLWILDEPFTAIDRQGVERLVERLSDHRRRGGISLLTSHQPLVLDGLQTLNLADYQDTREPTHG